MPYKNGRTPELVTVNGAIPSVDSLALQSAASQSLQVDCVDSGGSTLASYTVATPVGGTGVTLGSLVTALGGAQTAVWAKTDAVIVKHNGSGPVYWNTAGQSDGSVAINPLGSPLVLLPGARLPFGYLSSAHFDRALGAGEAHVGEADAWGQEIRDEWTRPADTTTYAANDVLAPTTNNSGVTALRSLAIARRAGKAFWLTYCRIVVQDVAFVARVRVHLYTVAQPPTAIAGDNSAAAVVWANRAVRIGSFDLPAAALNTNGDCSSAVRDDLRIQVLPDPSDTKVYYHLQLLDAWANPVNAAGVHLTFRSSDN